MRGIEPEPEAISAEVFDQVARGDGHFLGSPDTMARMKSDYLYREISDRRSPKEWAEAGSPDIRDAARIRVREILDNHFPTHIPADIEQSIRRNHAIHLPPDAMAKP